MNTSESKEKSVDPQKKHNLKSEIFPFIRDIVIIVLVFWLINTFIGTKTIVIGDSMEPQIHDNDIILLNRLTYRFSDPERYDVIVFPYNDGEVNYIKRIIGLPGEEISIQKVSETDTGYKIFINGEMLDENFGLDGIQQMGSQTYPLVIPENHYFVMGDNRNESSDSRYVDVGTIERDEIMGKAWIRILPISQISKIQ